MSIRAILDINDFCKDWLFRDRFREEFKGKIYSIESVDYFKVHFVYKGTIFELTTSKSGQSWLKNEKVTYYVIHPKGIKEIGLI